MKKLLAIFLFLFSSTLFAQNPVTDSIATITVSRIIDGDTFEFVYNSEKYKVRILGIDCYETKRGERLDKQAEAAGISSDSALTLGKRQKQNAIDMLLNKTVTIIRDGKNFDFYNRLLRHVIIGGKRYEPISASGRKRNKKTGGWGADGRGSRPPDWINNADGRGSLPPNWIV